MSSPAAKQPETKQMKAIVDAITEADGGNVKILRLRPEEPLDWLAGQYLDIGFGGLAPRSYSIANAPGDGTVEIHVKRGPGEGSAYVLDILQKGEQVRFSGPYGRNVFLAGQAEGPVLAVAGGLGIAPLKAIAEEALRGGFKEPFILFWATADESDKYISAAFEQMAAAHDNFDFVPVSGYSVTEMIARNFHSLDSYRIFVSGPPAMISAVIEQALRLGADPAKIGYDRHPEAAAPAP